VALLKVLKLDAEGSVEADAPRASTSLRLEDQQDTLLGNGGQKEVEAESRGEEDGEDAVLAACRRPPSHTHAGLQCQRSGVTAELLYTAVLPSLNFQKPQINLFPCFCLSS